MAIKKPRYVIKDKTQIVDNKDGLVIATCANERIVAMLVELLNNNTVG